MPRSRDQLPVTDYAGRGRFYLMGSLFQIQGLPAGLSGVRPTRVEPQEAATPQQHLKPRTNPKNIPNQAAWMRRRPRNPPNDQSTFAHLHRQSQTRLRDSPIGEWRRSHGALHCTHPTRHECRPRIPQDARSVPTPKSGLQCGRWTPAPMHRNRLIRPRPIRRRMRFSTMRERTLKSPSRRATPSGAMCSGSGSAAGGWARSGWPSTSGTDVGRPSRSFSSAPTTKATTTSSPGSSNSWSTCGMTTSSASSMRGSTTTDADTARPTWSWTTCRAPRQSRRTRPNTIWTPVRG